MSRSTAPKRRLTSAMVAALGKVSTRCQRVTPSSWTMKPCSIAPSAGGVGVRVAAPAVMGAQLASGWTCSKPRPVRQPRRRGSSAAKIGVLRSQAGDRLEVEVIAVAVGDHDGVDRRQSIEVELPRRVEVVEALVVDAEEERVEEEGDVAAAQDEGGVAEEVELHAAPPR
jgi:hypothetical protein